MRPKHPSCGEKYETFEFPFKLIRPALISTPIRGFAADDVQPGRADDVTITIDAVLWR